jgi:transposase, IS5 family
MKPSQTNHRQGRLFEQRLSELLNPNHELCVLAEIIRWDLLEKEFDSIFIAEEGKPAKPVRLITGIMLLQHMYGLSDEGVVAKWVENPYWQLFCGYDYLQWQFPIHPTTLTKWRQRMGVNGMEKLLCILIDTARVAGAVKESSFKKVIVDTTVAPKAIAFPTDARLYLRSLKRLVSLAKAQGISLRQTYERLGPQIHRRANQLFHSRKHKMAHKEVKRLKGYCGRVFREVLRAIAQDPKLQQRVEPVLFVIGEILIQTNETKEKVYSLHEPRVECIAKGKAHKKYEFGCKASIALTHKEGFVVGAQALHGNPYDGHTLADTLAQVEQITGQKVDQAYVDKGYKGHGVKSCDVRSSGSKRRWNWRQRQDLKRRQAIEPHIGHMKADGKLGRNFLKGLIGDKLHVLLCGVGHNMRLLCNFIKARQHLCPS